MNALVGTVTNGDGATAGEGRGCLTPKAYHESKPTSLVTTNAMVVHVNFATAVSPHLRVGRRHGSLG